MAQALAANCASKIFIIGRRLGALQETAKGGPDGTIIPVQGDITSKESFQAAYETISSQTEYVDLLIANSGVVEPNPKPLFQSPGPDTRQPRRDPRETLVYPRGGLFARSPD